MSPIHPLVLVAAAILGAAVTVAVAYLIAPTVVPGVALVILPILSALVFWLRRRN